MGSIWSERRKIDEWLTVEKAVCAAWNRRGRIPDEAMSTLRSAACDLNRMHEIEKEVDHDVIAFLRATSETVGGHARFIHLGLTSSDVVDTALARQCVAAVDQIASELDRLIAIVGNQALQHRDTIMIGRTHGMH